MFQFKTIHPFELRKSEAERIRSKYPDRIPVIVEKNPKNQIADIDKHKFLIPSELTIGQLMFIIRKRINLNQEQAIFLFVNNRLPQATEQVSSIYDKEKDEDGFLYIHYSGENCFGSFKL